jgi:hypothetical protein
LIVPGYFQARLSALNSVKQQKNVETLRDVAMPRLYRLRFYIAHPSSVYNHPSSSHKRYNQH